MESFIGPALAAAVITGIVAIVALIVNRSTVMVTHASRLKADARLAEKKIDADIALSDRKFALDRALSDWKRRTELAEQVLSDFYKAQRIFGEARVPWSTKGEGGTRVRRKGEEPSKTDHWDAIYAPYERLTKHIDFISEMHARRFKFMANFGKPSEEPFLAFYRCYNRVAVATGLLLREEVELDLKRAKKLEADIGWRSPEEDEIALQLKDAVEKIEGICRPVLDRKAP